ncbi:hypothetical protein ACMAZF_19980 [Psychrobium sp. nBUS_13]|uniref:hypothetical protein n=1 Tax=Psychrobium sp. nBUS_13 TaxID=3395319 RepID=UPI003EBA3876
MSWNRFQYICREVVDSSTENTNFSCTIKNIDSSIQSDFYGKPFLKESFTSILLNKMSQITAPKEAIASINKYRNLVITQESNFEQKNKRSLIYLVVVGFFFCLLSLLFQQTLLPSFTKVQAAIEFPKLVHFYWFEQHIALMTTVVLFTIFMAVIVVYQAYKMSQKTLMSKFSKLLFPYKICLTHQNIISMLEHPLPVDAREHTSDISGYLDGLNNQRYIEEWNSIFNYQTLKLNEMLEVYIKCILSFVGLGLMAVIGNFIYAIYQPIMSLQGLVL